MVRGKGFLRTKSVARVVVQMFLATVSALLSVLQQVSLSSFRVVPQTEIIAVAGDLLMAYPQLHERLI